MSASRPSRDASPGSTNRRAEQSSSREGHQPSRPAQTCATVRREVQMIFQDPYGSSTLGAGSARSSPIPSSFTGSGPGRNEDARCRSSWRWSDSTRSTTTASRPTSPAGQRQRIGVARALALRPSSSSATSRSRLSTCRSRPRSSTCSSTCRTSSTSPTSSSPTTCRSSATSATGSRSMYLGKIVELAPAGELFSAASSLHARPALRAAGARPRPDRQPSAIVLTGDLPAHQSALRVPIPSRIARRPRRSAP